MNLQTVINLMRQLQGIKDNDTTTHRMWEKFGLFLFRKANKICILVEKTDLDKQHRLVNDVSQFG